MSTLHIPVLPDEVLQALGLAPGQIVVDGTLGGAGHTLAIARRVAPMGKVISMDRDIAAIELAQTRIGDLPINLVHANFSKLPEVLDDQGIDQVDSILLDLGLSSDQLNDDSRGFSYHAEGELDLRFDIERGEPAWRLIQRLGESHLADLIYQYGEEKYSRRIARKIVDVRRAEEIRTADQLARLVRSCVPRSKNHRIDPATRTFQALRIAVNDELGALETVLRRAPDRLKEGGRLIVISFHSLEDRMVKTAFREHPKLDVITRKPIRPTEQEQLDNPRSRSSRLRIAQRIQD